MSTKTKVISSCALFIWTALVSFLLYRNYSGSPFEVPDDLSTFFSSKVSFYDVYNSKKKIGFAETTFEEVGDEIIIRSEQDIRLNTRGPDDHINQKIKYLCNKDYSLKSFRIDNTVGNNRKTKLEGTVEDDDMLFFIESDGNREPGIVPTNGRNIYLPSSLIHLIIQRRPPRGSVFVAPLLNIINPSVDNVRVVTEDIIPVKVGFDIRSIYKFRMGNLVLWATEDGTIVKRALPDGISYYRQSAKIVKEPEGRILFDYTILPYFDSNTLIFNAEEVQRVRVKLHGIRLDPGLYEKSLASLSDNELTIVRGTSDNLVGAGYTVPVEDAAMEKYIKPDEWIESDNKDINYTGRVYARSKKNDAYKLTAYLTGYVHNLVGTGPLFFLQDTETILKTLQGDFLERAVMFASYARAAGMPTRLIGGLVYRNGHFFFHAWNEVWFGKWIPVDPTFYEFPADATHIPLVEGTLTDVVSILEELKHLKIEVMEVS